MQKLIIFLLSFTICNIMAQKIPIYREVNICGQEGMSKTDYFQMVGESKYLSIITDFEKQFKKSGHNYSDYYRMYVLPGGIKPKALFVSLIPKSIVSEENKKKRYYRVYGSKEILGVDYNLKTKKISKPYRDFILPDL